MPSVTAGLDLAALPVLPDEPGDLRQAEPCHLAQIGSDHPTLLLAPPQLLLLDHNLLHPPIYFAPALAAELDLLARRQKRSHLSRR